MYIVVDRKWNLVWVWESLNLAESGPDLAQESPKFGRLMSGTENSLNHFPGIGNFGRLLDEYIHITYIFFTLYESGFC